MVVELLLAAKDAPVPAPPTAKEQPPEVEAVTTARAAKLTVATPPHPQGAAVALLGVPLYAQAVVQLHARVVGLPVLELVRAHALEVAIQVAWDHARITVNTAVRIAVNSLDTSYMFFI